MAAAVRSGQVRLSDTIFALSSGRPPAAIGIVRISGPAAFEALRILAGGVPQPRRAVVRTLRDGGEVIDRALVLSFPGPASATGEDLVELHCHGGRAVIAAVEAALVRIPAMRRAEPGEFTRRALSNGRIDLLQAEGLADLLEAETETQRRAAIAAVEGRLSGMVQGWLDTILALSAEAEALLDYTEEGDVGSDAALGDRIRMRACHLALEIEACLAAPSVERLRDGVRIVIAGPPNAGKSTLLNALVEREAAIVSPISGTTRDRVEVPVARHGLPILLIDTAGLTTTSDTIETIGIERATESMRDADILLWLGDEPPPRADAIWVYPRCDQPGRGLCPVGPELAISSHDPASLATLWNMLATRAEKKLATLPDAPSLRERQRAACREAAKALYLSTDPLLAAEGLAEARRCLVRLLGGDEVDMMLEALFARFCVGK